MGNTYGIYPLRIENWADFENLFLSKGILRNCWCMTWRMTKEEQRTNTPDYRKEYMKERVMSGVPVGLLAYDGNEAVAWCSVGPKSTHRGLGGNTSLPNIWSLTCFFILPAYRRRGLAHTMIAAAKQYAKENEGKYLEAYPVLPDSPSYRHMGLVETFKKEGFAPTGMAGSRRRVMLFSL